MDTIELGGNIQLTGFSEIDGGKMIIVKKMVGNYARKFSDKLQKFEQLSITIKNVDKTDSGSVYELDAKVMDNGNPIAAEASDKNLFMAIDIVLKKIETSLN